jgi:hypothetical protein
MSRTAGHSPLVLDAGAFDPTAALASDTVFIKNFLSRGAVVTLRCEAREGELIVTGDGPALEEWAKWLRSCFHAAPLRRNARHPSLHYGGVAPARSWCGHPRGTEMPAACSSRVTRNR